MHNPYYARVYNPTFGALVRSGELRAELIRIELGFDSSYTSVEAALALRARTDQSNTFNGAQTFNVGPYSLTGSAAFVGSLTQSGGAANFSGATNMRVPAPAFIDSPVRQSDLAAAAFAPAVYPWDTVNSASQACVAGRGYAVNVTTCDLTLPANPAVLWTVLFMDLTNNAATGQVWVRRNGQTIMGVAEDMRINMNGRSFGLQFINDSWRLV